MPFMSYQVTPNEALRSAGRMMKEAGAHGVKLEGGQAVVETVEKIVNAGIPVMGHLGLTPQSIYQFGTYKVRATEDEEAQALIDDAKALEQAGCFSIVLEKIPASLAAKVTAAISIPTIGIGAGAECDGQVLVVHDMLGLNKEFKPRFLRRYADLDSNITEAVQQYISDIKSGDFPNEDEEYE
jgi:3-methyl-2-oxobutanoate hydroxymethyltransferase